ncbi:MAG: DUF3791 domain-containing protein [Bacteroidales bacterium]|nr:DUF3791 domain-containing protein [Bacteroidales bacterium]
MSFCIEEYKFRHRLTGDVVVKLFEESKIIDFLINNYEILHTQSKQYVQEEIDIQIGGKS